ncbi:RlpA-like double-psi beta-barrel-protein domain-containing protein-containing protein [Trichophaea hybrida]|nr:RlpA-like double-psi beta-barrel-protein domain-containing protein-containing protein [Trichophaea hybrida]
MFQRQHTPLLLLLLLLLLSITSTTSALPTELLRRGINGKASFYNQMGAVGSCGQSHSDNDYVVALSPDHFAGQNPCGKRVKVYARSGAGRGKVVYVIVADKCMGCDTNHLDLAVAPFEGLAGSDGQAVGVIQIAWAFK